MHTLPLLTFRLFEEVPHGVSTRQGGVSAAPFASLNLGGKLGDVPEHVLHNRMRLADAVGIPLQRTVALTQVHGGRVVAAQPADGGRGVLPEASPPEEADALITDHRGLALLVLAADCVPLLFWDPVHRAIGAAHAGWRGTITGTAVATLAAMAEAYGSRPAEVRVGIGPAIGPCCYEVDAPVLEPLQQRHPGLFDAVTRASRPGHRMLDLPEANRLQLLAAGVQAEHIEALPYCTACRTDLLFSERKEGRPSGRFGAIIALPAPHQSPQS